MPRGLLPLTDDSSLFPLTQILRSRRRAPDVARNGPDLGHLRSVAMPRARIEAAQRLVEHLVELGEHLDDLVVRVAVIGKDVVAGPVPGPVPR